MKTSRRMIFCRHLLFSLAVLLLFVSPIMSGQPRGAGDPLTSEVLHLPHDARASEAETSPIDLRALLSRDGLYDFMKPVLPLLGISETDAVTIMSKPDSRYLQIQLPGGEFFEIDKSKRQLLRFTAESRDVPEAKDKDKTAVDQAGAVEKLRTLLDVLKLPTDLDGVQVRSVREPTSAYLIAHTPQSPQGIFGVIARHAKVSASTGAFISFEDASREVPKGFVCRIDEPAARRLAANFLSANGLTDKIVCNCVLAMATRNNWFDVLFDKTGEFHIQTSDPRVAWLIGFNSDKDAPCGGMIVYVDAETGTILGGQ